MLIRQKFCKAQCQLHDAIAKDPLQERKTTQFDVIAESFLWSEAFFSFRLYHTCENEEASFDGRPVSDGVNKKRD